MNAEVSAFSGSRSFVNKIGTAVKPPLRTPKLTALPQLKKKTLKKAWWPRRCGPLKIKDIFPGFTPMLMAAKLFISKFLNLAKIYRNHPKIKITLCTRSWKTES